MKIIETIEEIVNKARYDYSTCAIIAMIESAIAEYKNKIREELK